MTSSSASLRTCTARRQLLVFATGYVSGRPVHPCRAHPGVHVDSDALNYASMIAGVRHSEADKRIFRHNDPQDLERLMAADAPSRPKLVCFEIVYEWMDVRPDRAICDVAERYGGMIISTKSCSRADGERGADAERDGLMIG